MSTTITTTKLRLDSASFWKLMPRTKHAIITLGDTAHASDLGDELLELINLRCSQINGCAWCVQYHSSNLKKLGVDEAKLTLLVTWAEAGIFSEREQAALAWAESLTILAENHVPDSAYEAASAVFSDLELACLTTAIATINVWNRINVSYRFAPEVN
jgi:AhpD family alkylhydroperoxidase